ncbi:hypothetical protein JCGZ_12947 [Jatropha curcas]|uniref:Uncharacterized protein n=1 Tax=Jatropha curcas TaxID=180498 RepID=A0A067LPK7_JATCU|nr:hypothetical protein JCGZ_12947 [Jatropha curcas]
MWHIVEKKPFNLCYAILDKIQGVSKKLPYGMILTPIFEFLGVNLKRKKCYSVSKLDSNSLKSKDEKEEGEEKEDQGKEKGKEKEKLEVVEKKKRESENIKEEKDKGNFGDFDKAEIEEAVKDKEGDEVEEISETKTKKLEISDEEELQPESKARKAPEQTPM